MGLLAYKNNGLPGSAWAEYERQRALAHDAWRREELRLRNTPEYRARAEAAQQRAYDRMDAGIRRAAIKVVKVRAKAYRDFPGQLEMVAFGLSGATASELIALGKQRLAKMRGEGLSGADLVVPVQAVNARACMVLGRYWRRFEMRMQEAAE
jgi:phage-related minor tail protein